MGIRALFLTCFAPRDQPTAWVWLALVAESLAKVAAASWVSGIDRRKLETPRMAAELIWPELAAGGPGYALYAEMRRKRMSGVVDGFGGGGGAGGRGGTVGRPGPRCRPTQRPARHASASGSQVAGCCPDGGQAVSWRHASTAWAGTHPLPRATSRLMRLCPEAVNRGGSHAFAGWLLQAGQRFSGPVQSTRRATPSGIPSSPG